MKRRGFLASLAGLLGIGAAAAVPPKRPPPVRYVKWIEGRGWVPVSPELWTPHQQAMLRFRQIHGLDAVSQIEEP